MEVKRNLLMLKKERRSKNLLTLKKTTTLSKAGTQTKPAKRILTLLQLLQATLHFTQNGSLSIIQSHSSQTAARLLKLKSFLMAQKQANQFLTKQTKILKAGTQTKPAQRNLTLLQLLQATSRFMQNGLSVTQLHSTQTAEVKLKNNW